MPQPSSRRRPTTALAALLFAALLSAVTAAPARAGGSTANLVTASLLADVDAAAPGSTFALGVRLDIKRGWHTYWVNPGEAGQATTIKMTGPAGFTFGPVQWPLPTRLEHDGTVTFGYEKEVLLLVPVTVAKDAAGAGDKAGAAGGTATLNADVSWLSCQDEACVGGGAQLSVALPVRPEAKPANAELFAAWRQRLPVARDQAAAVAAVDQPAGAGGAPGTSLTVRWNEPPRKVEWFPVATDAVAIGDIVLAHGGKETKITFKPTVYKADAIPDNRVDSLLVYEDAKGVRHGVPVPFALAPAKAAK
jgi:DsbC/DsbD-like thiol-disulfide interchange protein